MVSPRARSRSILPLPGGSAAVVSERLPAILARLGVERQAPVAGFLASLPFSVDDVTAGSETERRGIR